MTAPQIRALLATCRTELAKQWAIEKAATPGPWPFEYVYSAVRHISRNCGDLMPEIPEDSVDSFMWDYYISEYGGHDDPPVIVQSRNLNIARLRVAERLLNEADDYLGHNEGWCVVEARSRARDAAELLGVTP